MMAVDNSNSPLLEGMRSLVFRGRSEDRKFMERGRCAGLDPRTFFPDQDEGAFAARVTAAQSICNGGGGCEVRSACLEYALKYNEQVGVWGGESERGRRRIKRARAKQALARKKSKR